MMLAFPTAEARNITIRSRGGQVVTVTSLADDGTEGTLRWAFEQYPNEPITIVFALTARFISTMF